MNIMFEKEFAMGDTEEKELSEIDKCIKLPMISDALNLANLFRKDSGALQDIDEYNSLFKIYENSIDMCTGELDAVHNLKTIYDFTTGTKGKIAITSGQFSKLFNSVEYMRLGKLVKHDMAVIFSSVVGRNKSMMDFMDFNYAVYK